MSIPGHPSFPPLPLAEHFMSIHCPHCLLCSSNLMFEQGDLPSDTVTRMQGLDIYPKVASFEIRRYQAKALPALPDTFYYSVPNSASVETLLDHDVPSPSLYEPEEFLEVLSRLSCSTFQDDQRSSHTHIDAVAAIDELLGSGYNLGKGYRQTLLPPAPRVHYADLPNSPVDCRLSSTSSITTPPSSPDISKRSATPTLLEKLSTNIVDLTSRQRNRSSSSGRPITPVPSLSYSRSISSLQEADTPATASTTTIHIMYSPTTSPKEPRKKPTAIITTAGYRNISPPMPSPVMTGTLFDDPSSNSTSTYRPRRRAPTAPLPTSEVSGFDWDDDDQKPRLTRMKKSFTNLAVANRSRSDVSVPKAATNKKTSKDFQRQPISPPTIISTPSVRARSSLPLPGRYHTYPGPQNHAVQSAVVSSNTPVATSAPTRSASKLKKNNSVRTPSRKRATTVTSVASSTARTSGSATLVAVPTSSPKRRSRFSVAVSTKSKKSAKSGGLGRFRRWAKKVLRC